MSTSNSAIDGTRTHILLLDRELLQPIELRRQEVDDSSDRVALGHLHGAEVRSYSKAEIVGARSDRAKARMMARGPWRRDAVDMIS